MRRREFLMAAASATAWSAALRAQPAKIPRVGYFWPGFESPNVGIAGLRQGLQDRGYALGRNLLLEERYADGDLSRTQPLLAELLALDVDVLVTGDWPLIFAHTLTATVPIVAVAADFVGVGLAATLSRPGGNVTGVSLLSAELSPKWLELLKAAVPGLRRVGFLGGFTGLIQAEKLRLDETAPRYGVTLTQLDTHPSFIEESFAAIGGGSFDGLIVADDFMAEIALPKIIEIAAQNRLPAIYGFSGAAKDGGLMSYSADSFELWRRLAGFVDRILKGARPGDIPIEQATTFITAVNLKTAKALGLDMPPTLLAAADEVIE